MERESEIERGERDVGDRERERGKREIKGDGER